MFKRYLFPLFLLAAICISALCFGQKAEHLPALARIDEQQVILLDAGHEGLPNTINRVQNLP